MIFVERTRAIFFCKEFMRIREGSGELQMKLPDFPVGMDADG
jgi:hypothetical protein